jgi:hypothetical protein
MDRLKYKDDLEKLTSWALDKGYSVEISMDGDNSVDREAKLISLSNKRPLEHQVCVLLHECGHIQIFENEGTLCMEDIRSKWSENSRKAKTSVLIEEVEAWRRGINLARKLRLSINLETIKLNMVNAILKYAQWC